MKSLLTHASGFNYSYVLVKLFGMLPTGFSFPIVSPMLPPLYIGCHARGRYSVPPYTIVAGTLTKKKKTELFFFREK